MSGRKPDLGWVKSALAIANRVHDASVKLGSALNSHESTAGSGNIWYTVGLSRDGDDLDLDRYPIKGDFSPAIQVSDDRIDDLDVRHMTLMELEASGYGLTEEVSDALSTIMANAETLSDLCRMLAEGVLDDLDPGWREEKS